jgi:hypothetical protein
MVPEGAVPFTCAPGVPDGAALFPPVCCVSVDDGVDDETALPVDGVEVLEVLVQPAIMIPAMRIADAISMSILLFFIEQSPELTDTSHQKGKAFSISMITGRIIFTSWGK